MAGQSRAYSSTRTAAVVRTARAMCGASTGRRWATLRCNASVTRATPRLVPTPQVILSSPARTGDAGRHGPHYQAVCSRREDP